LKDFYDIVSEWKKRPDGDYALATLVRTAGSSYRRPGARMLICRDGETIGSLSAGCLEDEVAIRAGDVLRTGEPAIVSFDTRRRFGCAGKVDIFIEPVSSNFFSDLVERLDVRQSCCVITRFRGIDPGSRIARFDRAQEHELKQEIHPPIQVLIVGDGPDNLPVRLLGALLGWEMVEIADANTISVIIDDWKAAIVKSHNYGRDFVALQKLLPLNLRYVGLIGPRKRRDQLMNDLLNLGVTINAGFFAPAGLDLGAETSEEIALAIVSEIQRVFWTGSGESLRDRRTPIHAASEFRANDLANVPLNLTV
jgi:xanthine dehydrogenase accessory factor